MSKSTSPEKTGPSISEQGMAPAVSFFKFFPARIMVVTFVVSIILLSNALTIREFEARSVLNILQFLKIPSFYLDGQIFTGEVFDVPLKPQTYIHMMYISHLIALIISASTSMLVRAKIAGYTILLFGVLILGQALTVPVVHALGKPTEQGLTQTSIIVNSLTAGAVLALMLFTIIPLPKPTKIQPVIRRNYFKEYGYFAILLASAAVFVYAFMVTLNINEDSILSAYVALQIPVILGFRYYISYFFAETRIPGWVKKSKGDIVIPVSFLIPAYNEQATIARLIGTIDEAAARYKGKVEIVFVNDGSKDNTATVAAQALTNLKHTTHKFFNTENKGKGAALKFGLSQCTGEIIFRIDGDSRVDPRAIQPIVNHFRDPTVGSVSGMIFPIELKSMWQKAIVMVGCFFIFYKRGDEITDSILVQPGAFSVFRKEALEKVGGWMDDQFGEDGEITNRLGRYGYRNEFEQYGIAYSEVPRTFRELRRQRVRWSIAYFHSRARNLRLLKDINGPRSFLFMNNLISAGGSLPTSTFIPYVLAAILVGFKNFDIAELSIFFGIPLKMSFIHLFILGTEGIIYVYFLHKFNRLHYLKYFPFVPVFKFAIGSLARPEAIGILLSFAGKYKKYDGKESFNILRKQIPPS